MTTSTLRDKLATRRQARATEQTIRRDLASFRTDREVSDLLATLDGQDGAEVDTIRTILAGRVEHATTPLASRRPLHTHGTLV